MRAFSSGVPVTLLRSAGDLDHAGGAGRAELVHADLAVHDQRVQVAELPQRPGDHRHHRRVGDAHDLPARSGRVGQRPQQVHDRRDAELAAHRPHVAHGGVEQRREHEHDPDLFQDVRHPGGLQVDADAERLQHVRASAARGERAVPVFRDADPRPGGHQRGDRRDVERRHAPSTRARGVDQRVGVLGAHGDHRAPKRAHAARDLGGGRPLALQRHEEGGHLDRGSAPLHEAAEDGLRLVRREVLPPDQAPEQHGEAGVGDRRGRRRGGVRHSYRQGVLVEELTGRERGDRTAARSRGQSRPLPSLDILPPPSTFRACHPGRRSAWG
jgi:hypothetical protein